MAAREVRKVAPYATKLQVRKVAPYATMLQVRKVAPYATTLQVRKDDGLRGISLYPTG